TKPVPPSMSSEPSVLVSQPRTYADLALRKMESTNKKDAPAAPQLNVVQSLSKVSAISDNQLVQRHIQEGFALAQRGAYYSAKLEFEQALRVIAESLDAQQLNGNHGEQLTAAFDAIEEADEFFVNDPRTGGHMNLKSVAATHRTPLLREGKLDGLNQVAAM